MSAFSIAGRATFTIVMSSSSMKVATQTVSNVHHFRPITATYTAPVQETLDVSNAVAAELAGISDGVLDALKERLGASVRLRGNQLTLEGDDAQVAEARAVIDELVELVEAGTQIGSHTVDAVLGTLDAGQDVREVFDAVVWRHRGKKIAPKTLTQKDYVDSIRRATVTFGIGPAGTGKTYLAMALAVAALHEREVARIILTRPAVEAGERLGFLPGDLMAKVDPYLRPLFDALYDMLDPDKANNLMERGTIEVAPLAFMRGRAQPVSTPVLTMDGFKPIGVAAGRRPRDRIGRVPDPGDRCVPARAEGSLPRPCPGRRVDALLRRAPVACASRRRTAVVRPVGGSSKRAR